MALVLADRVKETTTTTGTGTITLAGASAGFQSFAAIGNGNTTYYTISGGTEWEVGIGTYTSAGTTLSRDTVLASSAGGTAKVNFSAGTKDVFVTYPAGKSVNQDAAGNVGIGTTDPGYRLDVASNETSFGYAARLRSNATAAGAILQFTNSAVSQQNAVIGVTDAGLLTVQADGAASLIAFRTNGAERGRFNSGGNLLVGTTTDKNRLTVTAGANTNSPTLGSAGGIAYFTNTDVAYGLNIGTSAADGHVWFQAQRTDGSATAYNLTLNEAGGNVGIGQSSPTTKLWVGSSGSGGSGTATPDAISLGNTFANSAGDAAKTKLRLYQDSSPAYYGFGVSANLMETHVPSAAAMAWYTGNTERMRLGSNGALALGGTGTDATLHIQQSYGGYDRLTQISPGSASKNAFNIMAARDGANADIWWTWGVTTGNEWTFQPGVNSSMNSSTGIYFTSSAGANKPGGGTWGATSDARVKTNITPITDAASRIMALKPSAFDYRAPEAHAGRIADRGFIAQDFEALYPHGVSESTNICDEEKPFFAEGEKLKSVALNNDFFADLVALVQEQQVALNNLRARVAELEGK